MKLLIFGGNGFVGSNITVTALEKGWEVYVASRNRKKPIKGASVHIVDITDFSAAEKLIQKVAPNFVINAAAIADIDYSELHKKAAYEVNILGAVHIARICAAQHIKYIFLSTDAVFDGKSESYTEEDATDPLNYYGKTKAEAEKSVIEWAPESIILRVSLILGYPLDSGNSFLVGLEKKLRNGESISAPSAIVRTPIDVGTLTNVIIELCQSEFRGILHIGCTQPINRFKLTRMLAEQLGYPINKIVDQTSSNRLGNKAPRHQMGVLNVSKANEILHTPMPTLEKTIESAVDRIKTKI
jgi:dTDP-4-dehydrorhamnose reductase